MVKVKFFSKVGQGHEVKIFVSNKGLAKRNTHVK